MVSAAISARDARRGGVRRTCGHERGDDGEGCALTPCGPPGATVGGQLVRNTVENEKFAVESVERAKPEVTVREQLFDNHFAVVDAVEERAHHTRLKHLGSIVQHPRKVSAGS
jgi:hypothetical protein